MPRCSVRTETVSSSSANWLPQLLERWSHRIACNCYGYSPTHEGLFQAMRCESSRSGPAQSKEHLGRSKHGNRLKSMALCFADVGMVGRRAGLSWSNLTGLRALTFENTRISMLVFLDTEFTNFAMPG